MGSIYVRKGDRLPDASSTLLDGDGNVIDLTLAPTIQFRMRLITSPAILFEGTAAKQNPPGADGKVHYAWEAGDTDVVGTYLAEWRVTFDDGRRLTVPNDGAIIVGVGASLEDMPTISPTDLLGIRRWIGSTPDDAQVAASFAAFGSANAAALAILEVRLADFETSASSISISGHGSTSTSKNIDQLALKVAQLRALVDRENGGSGLSIGVAQLARSDRAR